MDNQIKIEDFLSESEISECKKYLSQATEREKGFFFDMYLGILFNLIDNLNNPLEMRKNAYCNVCRTLKEFVGISPQSKPQNV